MATGLRLNKPTLLLFATLIALPIGIDSMGQPDAVGAVRPEAPARQLWKDQPVGRGRYRIHVTLEEQSVVLIESREG